MSHQSWSCVNLVSPVEFKCSSNVQVATELNNTTATLNPKSNQAITKTCNQTYPPYPLTQKGGGENKGLSESTAAHARERGGQNASQTPQESSVLGHPSPSAINGDCGEARHLHHLLLLTARHRRSQDGGKRTGSEANPNPRPEAQRKSPQNPPPHKLKRRNTSTSSNLSKLRTPQRSKGSQTPTGERQGGGGEGEGEKDQTPGQSSFTRHPPFKHLPGVNG